MVNLQSPGAAALVAPPPKAGKCGLTKPLPLPVRRLAMVAAHAVDHDADDSRGALYRLTAL